MWRESNEIAVGLALTGFAVVAVAYAVYGIYLLRAGLLRRPVERTSVLLSLAVLATVLWGAAGLLDWISTKLFTAQIVLLCDQLRYGAWIGFMLAVLRRPQAESRLSTWFELRNALPVGMVVLALVSSFGAALEFPSVDGISRFAVACQLVFAVLGLVLVEQVFRNQLEGSRWAAKPLCLGLGCVFVYDLYLFAQAVMFGKLDADAMSARGVVHAAAVPLLMMASRRNAHWLARVQVSRTAVFYSASLLLVGCYLLVIAGAGYYTKFFGGSWGGGLQVALLALALLALIALIFSGAQRARVRVFLNKHFFSYRYDYRLEWLRFTTVLSSKNTPQEVGLLAVKGLADLVECPAGSLWLKALGQDRYMQSAAWNMPRTAASEALDSAFSFAMKEREWILDLRAPNAGDAVARPIWLPELGPVWLAIPLLVADEMLGFVVLSEPRVPLELNWEVRDLLKTAARQAAGTLALMHATEALLETRKFDAFNRMSAFVVHDLKNIVTQLSLMLRNAERHRDNPEFQQDMLSTVENSLDKMRQLMLQLREGDKPLGSTSGVELAPLLHRMAASAKLRGRQLQLSTVGELATRGDPERLERVIGHLIQNAFDATPPEGTVAASLAPAAGSVRLTISDSGIGMSPEFVQTRLFRPFSSTKSSGMGIGLYESAQYIKELGGSIAVESQVGQGTVVTLLLPLLDVRKQSDLREEPRQDAAPMQSRVGQ